MDILPSLSKRLPSLQTLQDQADKLGKGVEQMTTVPVHQTPSPNKTNHYIRARHDTNITTTRKIFHTWLDENIQHLEHMGSHSEPYILTQLPLA